MKSHLKLSGALILVSLSACGLVNWLSPKEGRPFSHAKHGKEAELECESCHGKVGELEKATMPASLKKCMMCHEEQDEKHPERKLADVVGDPPVWTSFTALSPELKFSHKTHVGKEVACATCHKGIEANTGIDETMRMKMEDCQGCHAKQGVRDACEICHKELKPEVAPASHRQAWKHLHGGVVRAAEEGKQDARCTLCHDEGKCTSCHQEEAPADHTALWRTRAHGGQAGVDRRRCEMCHRTDFCDRCHTETAPISHVGTWTSPNNRHCRSCHLPLSASTRNCEVCHKDASHPSAPPRPMVFHFHAAGADCRSCHEATLPHWDNGDDCAQCH